LRPPARSRVSETARSSRGHTVPFLRTWNWRGPKGVWKSRTARLLFLRLSLLGIRQSAFMTSWKQRPLHNSVVHDAVHGSPYNQWLDVMNITRTMLFGVLCCCSLGLVGCAAISVRSFARISSPPVPVYFGGVQGDYGCIFHPVSEGQGWFGPIYGIVDMPFSRVADIAALPYDAYTSYEWSHHTNSATTFMFPSNPQGGANGRQPFSSDTNRTSAATASRRSP
jgi:uncharacterized protein YceK